MSNSTANKLRKTALKASFKIPLQPFNAFTEVQFIKIPGCMSQHERGRSNGVRYSVFASCPSCESWREFGFNLLFPPLNVLLSLINQSVAPSMPQQLICNIIFMNIKYFHTKESHLFHNLLLTLVCKKYQMAIFSSAVSVSLNINLACSFVFSSELLFDLVKKVITMAKLNTKIAIETPKNCKKKWLILKFDPSDQNFWNEIWRFVFAIRKVSLSNTYNENHCWALFHRSKATQKCDENQYNPDCHHRNRNPSQIITEKFHNYFIIKCSVNNMAYYERRNSN